MFKEYQRIVLTDDLATEGLLTGDVGTIVHVHKQGRAFELEFLTLDGRTAAVATVAVSQVRPVSGRDITHARRMEVSN